MSEPAVRFQRREYPWAHSTTRTPVCPSRRPNHTGGTERNKPRQRPKGILSPWSFARRAKIIVALVEHKSARRALAPEIVGIARAKRTSVRVEQALWLVRSPSMRPSGRVLRNSFAQDIRDRREIRCQGPSQRRVVAAAGRPPQQKSPTPGQKDEPTSKGGCSQLASRLSHQRMRISVSLAILSSLCIIRRSIAKSMDPRVEPTCEYRARAAK